MARDNPLNYHSNNNNLMIIEGLLCVENHFKGCFCSNPFSSPDIIFQMMSAKETGWVTFRGQSERQKKICTQRVLF